MVIGQIGHAANRVAVSTTGAEKVRVIALLARNAWMVLNVATVATATMREVTAKILSGGLHLGTTVAPTTPT